MMLLACSVIVSGGAQVIVADNTAGVSGGGLFAQDSGTQFNVTGAGTHVSVDHVVSMYKSFKTFKGNVESSVKAFDISKPGY